MKKIQVFDPALCCSTGVCGVDADQALINFSADVEWAKQQGAQVERFNLAQQPMAFAENEIVKAFLDFSGQEGLPLILLDGDIVLAGAYLGGRVCGVATERAGGCRKSRHEKRD